MIKSDVHAHVHTHASQLRTYIHLCYIPPFLSMTYFQRVSFLEQLMIGTNDLIESDTLNQFTLS